MENLLKFVPMHAIDNKSSLVKATAWQIIHHIISMVEQHNCTENSH